MSNFSFLNDKWPDLARLGIQAEDYVYSDPQSSLLKLRCIIEIIVGNVYRDLNLPVEKDWDLFTKLKNQQFADLIDIDILDKFHAIRIKANNSIHGNKIVETVESLWLLKEAFVIACWIYKSYKQSETVICKEFIKPENNGEKIDNLKDTIEELQNTLEYEKKKNEELINSSFQNMQQMNDFASKNKYVASEMNIDNSELKRRISIEDIFSSYTLTSGQTKLISELNNFLDDNNKNVFLLKGYAGTGKTFITKGLTEYFTSIGRNCIMAAPTGKAAKVIQEKTKHEAYTIHKTIYSDKDLKEYKTSEDDRTYKFYFDLRVNENSSDTVYIIDESSMLANVYSEMEFIRFGSGHLLNDLIKYINLDDNDHNKKIIFIGDTAQLPPVGMNFSPALSKDYLLEHFGLSVSEFELTEVLRQKEDSGILKNAIDIRKSLQDKVYNQLDINVNNNDIDHIEHHDFVSKYLEVTNNKFDKDTMIIAYTNASVKEYNLVIREQFFENTNQINIKDKIIILSNSSHNGIQLSNGDFGLVRNILSETEHRSIPLKRKNNETGEVEVNQIDLYFRDIELIVKDENDKAFILHCKIIENLLFSEQASLSSDENKAIYLDFVVRNKHLTPNTKEFKDTIRKDPYFNALKIKFGYAITCHKAQGSEWKNIFLNCKSHQKILSEGYFRWIYTAITRSSSKLYTLDEPHIGIFDGIKTDIPLEHIQEINPSDNSININISDNNPFNIQDKYLLTVYNKILSIVTPNNIKIIDIHHNQNQEQYTFDSNGEQTRIVIYYNGKNIITTINPLESNNLSILLKTLLESLKNHILIIDKQSEFEFSEDFLKELYLSLKETLITQDITIANIEHLSYLERYTFSRNEEIAIIDFTYNGQGQFTRTTPNNKSNSRVLIQDIFGVINV